MGFVKRMLEEEEMRGFSSKDTYVCYECIGDYALKKYITDNGARKKCDYCGKNRISVPIDDLMKQIMSGIKSEYENANDCMGYDSEEGRFYGAATWDNYDLIAELDNQLQIESDKLRNDIIGMMNDSITWCKKSPYISRENEEMLSLWHSFCDQVKYKSRYVFFHSRSTISSYYAREPFEILDYIGKSIENLGLIKTLHKHTTFFRGRMHNADEKIEDAALLGSPPNEVAKADRMSPEGISMFYCANNAETALYEIYNKNKEIATIAEFYNMQDIKCIDFTRIDEITVPSLFDEQNRNNREAIIFLKYFNESITRRIEKLKGVEYVPIQIVAEYFRHLFLTSDGSKIDGIIYNSSIVKNGVCYALFFNNKQCIYSEKNKDQCKLRLRKSSIKRYKPTVEWKINE